MNRAVFLALLALVAAPAAALDRGPPAQNTGPLTATGTIAAGTCDTSQWTGYAGGTFSPLFACSGIKSSPTISNAYPGVVGIGDSSPNPVPVNDPTYLQRAAHLVQAKTALDNTKQESALGINFLNQTGGGGLPQTDHNQKVALSVFALAVPGASNMWAINTDLHVNAGVGNYSMYGREADHTNFNGDYKPGGCSGTCPAGQISGNFFGDFFTFTGKPVTAGTAYSGHAETGSKNMYYGLLFQPQAGFTAVGTGLISDATILDGTNATTSYQIQGNHTVGVGTTQGTMPYAFISAAGQNTCFNALDACWSYAGSNFTRFSQNGGTILNLVGATSGVNSVEIDSATAGFGPAIKAIGSDANVHLNLQPKGVNAVRALGPFLATGLSTFQSGIKLPASTVANLPTCNASNQDLMYIATDTTTPTYRSALTGGGAVRTPVYCDGASWTAH